MAWIHDAVSASASLVDVGQLELVALAVVELEGTAGDRQLVDGCELHPAGGTGTS